MPVDHVRADDHDPLRSLGWLGAAWIEHFAIHGPGDVQGERVFLTDELLRITVDMYALDGQGRRLYDSAFFSRPKGCDKSGHAGRVALFEALGPCRFDGWAVGGEVFRWHGFEYHYRPGEPMGRPVTSPLVRLMATEEGQVGNVYETVHHNLADGPLAAVFPRKDDVGLTRVFLPDGGRIVPSTASSAAKDGGRESFVVFDETHLYTLPELRRMYATVRRNLAKRRDAEPWSFETSTMYEPGRDSVAETSHDLARRIVEGKVRSGRFLFDHRHAPADVDLGDVVSLRAGLEEAYGDATAWMDVDRLIAEIYDVRNDPTDSRRFFLNQVTAAADAWIDPGEWEVCADPTLELEEGQLITVGFDGGKSDDHTALIACRIEDGALFTLGVWDPQEHGGEAPRDIIDGTVEATFERYDVVGFYADLHPWESYVDAWADRFRDTLCVKASTRHPVAFDMRARTKEFVVEGAERLHDAIVEGAALHDGNPLLTGHVINARRRPSRWGLSFGKVHREHPAKVDALAAAILASMARMAYTQLPEGKQRRRKKTGKAMFV